MATDREVLEKVRDDLGAYLMFQRSGTEIDARKGKRGKTIRLDEILALVERALE